MKMIKEKSSISSKKNPLLSIGKGCRILVGTRRGYSKTGMMSRNSLNSLNRNECNDDFNFNILSLV